MQPSFWRLQISFSIPHNKHDELDFRLILLLAIFSASCCPNDMGFCVFWVSTKQQEHWRTLVFLKSTSSVTSSRHPIPKSPPKTLHRGGSVRVDFIISFFTGSLQAFFARLTVVFKTSLFKTWIYHSGGGGCWRRSITAASPTLTELQILALQPTEARCPQMKRCLFLKWQHFCQRNLGNMVNT